MIHIQETRRRLLEGNLHPCSSVFRRSAHDNRRHDRFALLASSVLMCPHSCILNLPKPREHHPEREVGPGAILAGTIIQGMRLAEARGADMTVNDDPDNGEQSKKVSPSANTDRC